MIVQKLIFELTISLPPAVIAHWQYTLLIIQEPGLEYRCWHQGGGEKYLQNAWIFYSAKLFGEIKKDFKNFVSFKQ